MRPQIVLFGDSITEQSLRSDGWGSSLANTYSRKADVLVRGYGGYNTRWALFLLTHIFPLDSTKPPAAATIFFGANDAALLGRNSERQHVPVEEYKENLKKMVLHLKEDHQPPLLPSTFHQGLLIHDLLMLTVFNLNNTNPPPSPPLTAIHPTMALPDALPALQHKVHMVPFPLTIEFPHLHCCYSSHFAVSWIRAAAATLLSPGLEQLPTPCLSTVLASAQLELLTIS
ncbi:hypothetical protein SADUNF_Sadunf12G0062000 [Salix dunnii]|uniref:SGNH hydrolase-type esterase domain-containing protein n=1 Tax=Salix dunnii TaxID=1413687 RepID=A0A835JJV0_9ROSI|nr:hypothetical protein SADUNF_Sadunf12G0062000 [Salix dunnii]